MLVDTHLHWSFEYGSNPKELVEILKEGGIDFALVSGFEVLFKIGPVSEWNDKLVRFCREGGRGLIPMPTVYLEEPEKTIIEAQRCLNELGCKAFKIHPWLQGSSLSCPAMYKLCSLAADYQAPIMFHDGTPPYSLPSQIGLLARLFPQTIFVLGHSGILHFWEEAMEVARQNSNVYVTLCGGHPWAFERICAQVDNERILWGSDFIRPGYEELINYRRELLDCVKITKLQKEKIMALNAIKLYQIQTSSS